jgi:hypothetical protein
MSRCPVVLLVALACVAGAATPAAAAQRPRVSHFAFSPRTFLAAPGAAKLRFRLTAPARLRIGIARCRNAACTRRAFEGLLRRTGRRGRNALAWGGLVRGRELAAGRYRATLMATRRHRRSRRRVAFFRIKAPPRPPAPPPGKPTPPPAGGFPTPSNTGVPAGWVPARTLTSDLEVKQAGAVIQDVRLLNADIIVEAPNVTIRRVDLQGGALTNFVGNPCQGGMVVEDTTIEPPPGKIYSVETEGVIEASGYTARRVKIWRRSEGFRAEENCGPVRIEHSFAKIVIPPGRCDLHADGLQGYGGPWTYVTDTTIDFYHANCGTAPFFMPSGQDNTGATINGLLVMGGGYPFRLGVPGTVAGLKIVDKSWLFGPIDVKCAAVSKWDASIVDISSNYQVTRTVRRQRCNTDGGN